MDTITANITTQEASVEANLEEPNPVNARWGDISGDIDSQSDLKAKLEAKQPKGDYASSEELNNEIERANSVETNLAKALSEEVQARGNAIASEEERAKAREDEIESKIPSHDNFATKDELNKEVERAESVEDTLSTKISKCSLVTETGNKVDLELNTTTYELVAKLYDKNNNLISTSTTVDLPLETLVLNVEYDKDKKAIIITLKDGTTKEVPVSDLISGLVNETTFNAEVERAKKAESDLDTNKVNKEDGKGLSSNDYTDTEKTKLEGIEEGANKYVLPSDVVQDDKYVHTDNNFTDDLKTQIATNKEDIVELNKNKVDKVESKGLSTNDFTDAYKSNIEANNKKVSNVQADWNATEGEAVILNKPTDLENTSNKVTTISEDSTDTEYPSALAVYNLVKDKKILGVSRLLSTSSSAWSRTDDAVGLVANATKDGSSVVNDFDVLYPYSKIKSCNMNEDGSINAWYGDYNFAFDGSNGEVMTYIPSFYFRRWQDDTTEHIQISEFEFDGATKVDAFYVARYPMSYDTKAHSYNGCIPKINTNITTFRNYAKAKGDGWQQLDWHYFYLEMLYLVEYADYNSQSKLGNGVRNEGVNWSSPYDTISLVVDSTNIVSSTSRYVVGQYITIGTSAYGINITNGVQITAKASYNDGTVSGYKYTLAKAVSCSAGNYINSGARQGGDCDSLGMLSGCLNNDGYHSVIYRGIEDVFGNVFQFVDGLNIKDYVAYINYNPDTYAADTFTGDYVQVGYTNASGSNAYAKTVGYDSNNSIVALPTSVGGSESTYLCDYYYQNSGNRIVLVGGYFTAGASAGFFSWALGSASGITSWHCGARLLKTD